MTDAAFLSSFASSYLSGLHNLLLKEAFMPLMSLDVPIVQGFFTAPTFVRACEPQISYDLHHDLISVLKLRLLSAAGTLVLLFLPRLYAFLAKQLVLALIAFHRVPVLCYDLEANGAGDEVLHLRDLLCFDETLLYLRSFNHISPQFAKILLFYY